MMTQLTLTKNVGKNAMPDQIDVALVQTCLAHIKSNTKFGMKAIWQKQIDGKNSKELAQAIAAFQTMEKLKVTGRIEAAGGQTLIKIKYKVPSSIMPILAKNLAEFSHTSGEKRYTLAGGVFLTAATEDKVSKLARIYYALTGKEIQVNSGTRTPATQAKAMFGNMKKKRSWLNVYKNQILAGQIGHAFDAAQAAGQSDQATIAAMGKVISTQVSLGQYISNHLNSGAADIDPAAISSGMEKTAFKSVANEIASTVLFETTRPHWHLQF